MQTKRGIMVPKLCAAALSLVALAFTANQGMGEILSIPHTHADWLDIVFAGSPGGAIVGAGIAGAVNGVSATFLRVGLSLCTAVIIGPVWLFIIVVPRIVLWFIYEIATAASSLAAMASIEITRSAVLPGSVIAQAFLYNETLLDKIRELLWSPVRDLVNVGFAFLLITGAIITIVKANKEVIAQYGPKFMIGIILVNFSWFIPRVVLDVANVATVASFSFAKCNNCSFIQDVQLSQPDDCAAAAANNNDPNKAVSCPTFFLRINKIRPPRPDAAQMAVGGLYQPLDRILDLPVLPTRGNIWQRLTKLTALYNAGTTPFPARLTMAERALAEARRNIAATRAQIPHIENTATTARNILNNVEQEVREARDAAEAEQYIIADPDVPDPDLVARLQQEAEIDARAENAKRVANTVKSTAREIYDVLVGTLLEAYQNLSSARGDISVSSQALDQAIGKYDEAKEAYTAATDAADIADAVQTTGEAQEAVTKMTEAIAALTQAIDAANNAAASLTQQLSVAMTTPNALATIAEPPLYPLNWVGIGNLFECIWLDCKTPQQPLNEKITSFDRLLTNTADFFKQTMKGSIQLLILVFLNTIFMILYVFALAAMTFMVLLRIPIIWLTIGFMPVVALGFVIGRGGTLGGLLWGVWDKFIGAAFIPAAIGIPIAAGSMILNVAQSLPIASSGSSSIIAQLFNINTILQLCFIALAIIVIWLGVFFAINTLSFAGEAQKAIGSRLQSIGKGVAGATALGIASKTPILPLGKIDKFYGFAMGGLTKGVGKLTGSRRLQEQGSKFVQRGAVGHVAITGKEWWDKLKNTRVGNIAGGTRSAISSLFSGSALQKMLVGTAFKGPAAIDQALQDYGRGGGQQSLASLLGTRLRPLSMGEEDGKKAANALSKDSTGKGRKFMDAASTLQSNPGDTDAKRKLLEVLEELRKQGIKIDSTNIPGAMRTILDETQKDTSNNLNPAAKSINIVALEQGMIQAEKRAAAAPPPPPPPPPADTP